MKKLFLMVAFVAFSLNAQAQFTLGVNAGIPAADASDVTSFSYGVDVNYMLSQGESFSYGIASGIQMYSGKDNFDNWSFLPIGAALRFSSSSTLSFGADVGYALGLSPDGNDGGFYYRPMLIYGLNDNTHLNLSYSGISLDGATVANFGVGVMFKL